MQIHFKSKKYIFKSHAFIQDGVTNVFTFRKPTEDVKNEKPNPSQAKKPPAAAKPKAVKNKKPSWKISDDDDDDFINDDVRLFTLRLLKIKETF